MNRKLHEDETELLRHAFRDVTPLKGRAIGQKKAEKKAAQKTEKAAAAPKAKPRPLILPAPKPSPAKTALSDLSAGTAAGVDLATVRKLKRGKMVVHGRLDLHGHTQDEAYSALGHFLAAMQGPTSRMVLIITGKSGVLRRQVPQWLNAPPHRARILSFTQARASDGGDGALYVLVRKLK
jgi:DNA-nicking Smr family endonuclease